MSTLEILVPIAVTRTSQRPLATRLPKIDGARVGWLDNLKANAGELLRFVVEALPAKGFAFGVVRATKNATAAAPAAVTAHLQTCDAVVLAIAD